MEETNVDPFLREQIQMLAQSDISKEDLTDSIAYFKGIDVDHIRFTFQIILL